MATRSFGLIVTGVLFAVGGVGVALAEFGTARLDSPLTDIPAGVARREDVNERLRILDERTRQLDERLAAVATVGGGANGNGPRATAAPLFCGLSGEVVLPLSAQDPNIGVVSGYRAVKAICEQACGSATARGCTPPEIAVSAQLGRTPADGAGWVVGGVGPVRLFDAAPTYVSHAWPSDCSSWTGEPVDGALSNVGLVLAATGVLADFGGGGATMQAQPCRDTRFPIVCCD